MHQRKTTGYSQMGLTIHDPSCVVSAPPRTPTCSSSRSASLWGNAQRESSGKGPIPSPPFQAGWMGDDLMFILDRNGDVWEFHEILRVLETEHFAFFFGSGRISATKRPCKNYEYRKCLVKPNLNQTMQECVYTTCIVNPVNPCKP